MTDDQPKRGRPSDYSFQVAISICARLAEGKSLRAICSEAGMPGRATVFRWIARHKEFRDEYTLACELRAEDLQHVPTAVNRDSQDTLEVRV
jgi:transposase-like protein